MAIGYKYAERDADSQVNWAEVGKGITDMLAETNRVRQDKKDALDVAQRETMNYLAETPNGEHVGARQSILEYSDQASNQMRIMKRLMEQGQMSVKDYTIFRQNLTDNTNLAFNANKAYQEGYELTKQRERDGISSGLEPDNWSESEEFGNWGNIGWQIAPNGTVMAGKMVEEEIDGKKVRTLDKTPGGLRSMNYLNQAILGRIDKYDYEKPVDQWVDNLGKNIEVTTLLGTYGSQGLSRSLEDVTRKTYKKDGDRQIEYNFIQSENDKIKEIAGTNLDSARILYDSAKIAPNGKPYVITTNAQEAKKGDNFILKVVDPESGGFKYDLTNGQKKDTEEFIRTQMRAKYDKIEKEEAGKQLELQESADTKARAAAKYGPKDETPEPIKTGEILEIRGTNAKGKKVLVGISQRLENAITTEVKGVQNIATDIGYNRKNGALEIRGYQVSGKESEGTKGAVDGTDVTSGSNVVKKQKFVKNDINSAPLLSIMVKKIPNPNNPGYNFESVAQAKAYYKSIYEGKTGNKELD